MGHRLRRRTHRFRPRVLDHEIVGSFADTEIHRRIAKRKAGQVNRQELAGFAHDRERLDLAVIPNGVADGAAHAGRIPSPLDADSAALARNQRRQDALTSRGGAVHQARDEVVVSGVAQRAELLEPAHTKTRLAAAERLETRLQHELVAKALLRLTRDRRHQFAAVDDLGVVEALLFLSGQIGQKAEHRGVHVEGQRSG